MRFFLNWMKQFVPAAYTPTNYLIAAVEKKAKRRVINGPFAGLIYASRAVCGAYLPRLIGCYEKELHAVLHELSQTTFHTIVDIGAAEGYYACGLAVRFPASHVIAFEVDEEARQLLASMANENGLLDRLEIRGLCDESGLLELLTPHEPSLIVCDCEGCEIDILTDKVMPQLANAHLIVETHDFVRPGVLASLSARLARTHFVSVIAQQPRTIADWPVTDLICRLIPASRIVHELREGRPAEQSWIYAKPLAGAPLT